MMISQVRKHYKELKFTWKRLAKLFSFFVFLYLIWFVIDQFKSSNYFPITEVKIGGVEHEQQEIQSVLEPLVKKGFFVVDVSHIKERLLQFPWIADASVQRVWPHQIVIQVSEKKPLARWNRSGLLTQSGVIFSPAKNTYPDDLPQFIGPEGEQVQLLNFYNDMTTLLAPLHFKVVQLELSPTRSWSLILSNGMKVNLGYKDVLTRMNHFVKVYPKIVGERTNGVEYVDLRYNNGMAVRWKA